MPSNNLRVSPVTPEDPLSWVHLELDGVLVHVDLDPVAAAEEGDLLQRRPVYPFDLGT